jgi:Protein of unknown function (DUF1203)
MDDLRMIAIPIKVAELVRTTMKAPGYGHPAHREIASGYGPCRLCLKTFRVAEEERILFTYDPFHDVAGYPLPGPIFIHANACGRYEQQAGFPQDLRVHALTIVAYADERMVVGKEYIRDGEVEEVARQLLHDARTKYLHVRDTVAGCYDLRIERAR